MNLVKLRENLRLISALRYWNLVVAIQAVAEVIFRAAVAVVPFFLLVSALRHLSATRGGIIAMLEPRRPRIALSGIVSRSQGGPSPSANRISPETLACGGSSRMTASDVMDFPEPDSPTRPSTLPLAIENERSRTARNPAEGVATTAAGAAAFKTTVELDADKGTLRF